MGGRGASRGQEIGRSPLGDGRGASIGALGGGANGSSKPNDGAGLGTRKACDGVMLAVGVSGLSSPAGHWGPATHGRGHARGAAIQ